MKESTLSTSAASKVLNTVELLESILGHLPYQEVLILQGVSKCWNATIHGSSLLQNFLCFKRSDSAGPQPSSYENGLDHWEQPPAKQYPLTIPNATSAHDLQTDSRPYLLNPSSPPLSIKTTLSSMYSTAISDPSDASRSTVGATECTLRGLRSSGSTSSSAN